MINAKKLIAQENTLITNLTISHTIKYPKSFDSNDSIKRHPLILSLHGHGSNEADLIGLAPNLQSELFWVSGRGPSVLGANSFDWYELPPTPVKIANILTALNKFIEELIVTYPVDTSRIYLLGFSQGSMIALSYVMAYPERIAGVIAQSGAIPPNIGLDINKAGLKNKPIIITHGTEDRAMPIIRGRETRDTLVNLGAQVEFNEFRMGHTITQESIASVRKWLSLQLNK